MELITACGYGKLELVDMHRYGNMDMACGYGEARIWRLWIWVYKVYFEYFIGMAAMGLNLRFGA
jgi:hypothetical protein